MTSLALLHSHLKPYPEYKDSGAEWLGQIPTSWEAKRLRFVAQVNPRTTTEQIPQNRQISFIPMEAVGEYGGLNLSTTKDLADVANSYTCFRDGDVLVAKITPCFENGKGALARELLNGIGFGTTELHVLRPSPHLDARFLAYVTYSRPFRKLGEFEMKGTAGQQRVSDAFVRNFWIPLPSTADQIAIAEFLDRETAEIDALKAKKERLIELLQEKRAALITHAVTKGLDPNVPIKDSGVEWLEAIPTHWDVERNRHLFRESDRRSQFGEEELLTVSHITGVTRRSEKEVTMIEPESHEGYKLCAKGELAVNTMWAWMGALGIAWEDGMVSPSYNVYRITSPQLTPRYYDYLCRTPVHVTEIIRHSKGIWRSRLRLYPESFYEIRTPRPPRSEQSLITDFLNEETTSIDALVDTIRQGIDRLIAYRTAIISAAVTGKIDVRQEVS